MSDLENKIKTNIHFTELKKFKRKLNDFAVGKSDKKTKTNIPKKIS